MRIHGRTIIINSFLISIFVINVVIMTIPIQDKEFLDSNEFYVGLLRGIGWQKEKSYHVVPRLTSNNSLSNNQAHTFVRASQYSVPGWVDTRWKFRKNITIQSSKVSGDLTDFPILIDIIDEDLYNNIQVDGGDIFFTNSTGHKLPHEIDICDRHSSSTQIHLVAWIKIPNLSSTKDTTISMYYGNPTCANQDSPEEVWDNNYMGVWHLSESPTGPIIDSSDNNNDGTSYGSMTTADQVEGKIDGSLAFDGDDDYISCGDVDVVEEITVSLWVKFTTINPPANIDYVTKGGSYKIWQEGNKDGFFLFTLYTTPTTWNTSAYINPSQPTDTWMYLVGKYDGSTTYFYVDGVLSESDPLPGTINQNDIDLEFGRRIDNGYLNGSIDEVRISNVSRSVDWIVTEYNNQYDLNSFYSVSPKETSPVSVDWAQSLYRYRKNITINASQVLDDLTNFTVLVDLNDPDLHDTEKVQADGDDIVFTDASGTPLAHEIEVFDQTGNGTHAHLVAWIKVPILSDTSDTNITMYYGNNAVRSQANPNGVWENTYIMVQHLQETSGSHQDSTSYGNDGITSGGVIQDAIGKIGGADALDGSNDKVQISESASLDPIDDITVETWVKFNELSSTKGEQQKIIFKRHLGAPWVSYELMLYTDDNLIFQWVDTNQNYETAGYSGVVQTDTWYHIVGVRDGTSLIFYINGNTGINTWTDTVSGTMFDADQELNFGSDSSQNYLNGTIDEVRISNVARSPDYIMTEYNNQYDPNSFYSVCSEEEYSCWWADASFTKRKDIVINKEKISGNLTNFPLLVDLTTSVLRTGEVQPDADDIIFTTANGSKLAHEIDYFDQQSANGHLIAWVRLPTISTLEDTVISMYYGNTELGAQENPEQVWDSDYVAVWHLSEDPTTTIYDSTVNSNDGNHNNSMTSDDLITSKIGLGLDFDHVDDHIVVPYSENLGIVGNRLTLEAWIYLPNVPYPNDAAVIELTNATNKERYMIGIDGEVDPAKLNQRVTTTDGHFRYDNGTIYEDAWTQISVVYDGSLGTNPRLFAYIDGQLIASNDASGDILPIASTYNVLIGKRTDGRMYEGRMDELRISNISRSSDYIATSYSNQEDPSTFYSLGAEVIFDADPPVIEDFGIEDPGTGIGKFWAVITDAVSDVQTAKITINGTEYDMSKNTSGYWIYQHSVDWLKNYVYQITNASDEFENYLAISTIEKNHFFNNDKKAPDVLQWKYTTPTNTFRANVSDSWGEVDIVIVNVTSHSTTLPDPFTQIMGFYQDFGESGLGYVNDTFMMANGDIEFKIFVNDTSGNSFLSSTHPGVVWINHPPIAENLTLSPSPLYSNETLKLYYNYYDEDNHGESGTEIRWYKNGILQAS
ncbi:MAG: DUF2341 domain-containing protein, partial [Candidatus Thorarchaeota archaeon]